jgi:NADH:ubiquinone oxidoreductase subunit 2 (subunit N)
MIMAVLPEILLLLLGIIVLIVDLLLKEEKRRNLGWLTAGGLLAILVVSLLVARPSEAELVWGGMVRYDGMGFFFKMLFIFAAAMTSLFMMDHKALGHRGEAYLLLLASTLGMSLMASASDIIMLYLAIETTSIPLYILAGFVIITIHVIIMVIVAKLFKLDLFSLGVASLANIGGVASAPILASAYSKALIPIGVLMAMMGYIVGTFGGLMVGKILEMIAG